MRLDVKPDKWEDRLVLFVGYLVNNDRKASTINIYISAIKTVLQEDGFKLNEDRFLLNSLTHACKYRNHKLNVKLPIHKELLHSLLREVDRKFLTYNNQPYLATLYKAIFSTAYYGLFRIGEITKGTHPVMQRMCI